MSNCQFIYIGDINNKKEFAISFAKFLRIGIVKSDKGGDNNPWDEDGILIYNTLFALEKEIQAN